MFARRLLKPKCLHSLRRTLLTKPEAVASSSTAKPPIRDPPLTPSSVHPAPTSVDSTTPAYTNHPIITLPHHDQLSSLTAASSSSTPLESASTHHNVASSSPSQHPYASDSSSSSSSSSQDIASQSLLPDPIEIPPVPPVPLLPRELSPHPFDTHALVKHLEGADMSRGLAHEIMSATRALMMSRKEDAKRQILDKEEAENLAYRFSAEITDVKNLLSLRTTSAAATRAGLVQTAEREVESLSVTIKEGIDQLKHDIEMDLHNRKADTRAEQQAYGIGIEEINGKWLVTVNDLRTDIERYKAEEIKRFLATILIVVAIVWTVNQFPAIYGYFTLIAPDGSKAQPGKKHKTNLLKHPAYSNNNFGNDWAEGGRECMGGLAGAA